MNEIDKKLLRSLHSRGAYGVERGQEGGMPGLWLRKCWYLWKPEVLESLELTPQVAVSCSTLVLETTQRCAFNH